MYDNQALGVLFGGAIGDALGLGAEFMTREEVVHHYPGGLKSYGQIIQDKHRSRWEKGAWTDDTDQILCLARSILKEKSIHPSGVAEELYRWFKGAPVGIGLHTYRVFSLPQYTQYPEKAAQLIWKMSNQKSASNGAIMRTAIIGLFDDVAKNAESICKLTHFDPRCVGSCVIVSTLIHSLLHGTILTPDEMIDLGHRYDDRIEAFIRQSLEPDITELKLDEPEQMGYTLKTLSAALWAYFHGKDFESTLIAIVNAGGDADTNGAVAGALLGAKFGFDDIPKRWINELNNSDMLLQEATEIIELSKR